MIAVMGRRPKSLKTPHIPAHPLLQWREHYGVNQRELSAACGVSQGMLSKIENRQRIPLHESLDSLTDYTGLPIEAFIRPDRYLKEQPDFLASTRPPHGAQE